MPTVPTVNVWVHKDFFGGALTDPNLRGIVQSTVRSVQATVSNNVCLLITLGQNFTADQGTVTVHILKVFIASHESTLKDFIHRHKLRTKIHNDVRAVKLQLSELSSISKLTTAGYPSPEEMIEWAPIPLTEAKIIKESEDPLYLLRSCSNISDLRSMMLEIHTPAEQLALAHADVWRSILKNHSFAMPSTSSSLSDTTCINSVLRKGRSYDDLFPVKIKSRIFSVEVSSTDMFAALTDHGFKGLRFLTCGIKGEGSLEFLELLSAYGWEVWVNSIVLIFLVSLAIGILSKNLTWLGTLDKIFTCISMLLEQSNSFHNSVFKFDTIRCVASIFGLACVVLSNAYKNTNVYNMILPKKVVPYNLLQELVHDQYSIYSRSVVADFKLKWFDRKEPAFVNQSGHQLMGFGNNSLGYHYQKVAVFSEVHRILSEVQSQSVSTDRSGLLETLENVTKLYPDLKLVLRNLIEEGNAQFTGERWVWTTGKYMAPSQKSQELWKNLTLEFFEKESNVLFDLIKNCSKTAIVQPEYLCNNFSRQLQSLGKGRHVFIGKEAYTNPHVAYFLEGIVAPFIIRRIKGVQTAGIWQQWSSFFSGKVNQNANEEVVTSRKAPNMTGNILLIFFLLVYGFTGSLIGFIAEVVAHNLVIKLYERRRK